MTKGKQCWFCHKAVMEEKGDYLQCPECGATLTDLPKPGPSPMVEEYIPLRERRPGAEARQRRPPKRRGK